MHGSVSVERSLDDRQEASEPAEGRICAIACRLCDKDPCLLRICHMLVLYFWAAAESTT